MILTSTEEEASMILGTVHKVYSWNPCTSHFPCHSDEMPDKGILGTILGTYFGSQFQSIVRHDMQDRVGRAQGNCLH